VENGWKRRFTGQNDLVLWFYTLGEENVSENGLQTIHFGVLIVRIVTFHLKVYYIPVSPKKCIIHILFTTHIYSIYYP